MGAEDDDLDDGLVLPTPHKSPRQVRFPLGQAHRGSYRRRSMGQEAPRPIYQIDPVELSPLLNVEAFENAQSNKAPPQFPGLSRSQRSRSNVDVLDCKSQWANGLLAQSSMQNAWKKLEEDVAKSQELAKEKKWEDLMMTRANVTKELDKLAKHAEERKQKRGKWRKGRKCWDEFCMVAFEYSKLLDVVMNSCPHYVVATWGVMKILLVANINSAKLKERVETWLIEIGNQLGIVNQYLCYSPTEGMVEAVAVLYTSFSSFLGEALKCYIKSKLRAVLQPFSFPWERLLQEHVDQISRQFCKIESLGHVKSHSLLHSIHKSQQDLRCAQSSDLDLIRGEIREQLRAEVRDEIRDEMNSQISEMINVFNTRWLQRFEDLIPRQSSDTDLKPNSEGRQTSDVNVETLSVDPGDYIAENVGSSDEILNLRHEVFPSLVNVDSMERFLRVRNRRLRPFEYRYCAGLLRKPEIRTWMTAPKSGLLWLETYTDSRFTDWTTALALDMIDQQSRFDHNTVLRAFCQTRVLNEEPPSIVRILQSVIFQVVEKHGKKLEAANPKLTKDRFKSSRDDVEQLWALLMDVLDISETRCIWLLVEHVDMLEESADKGHLSSFFDHLSRLADSNDRAVKILVTSRSGGNSPVSRIAREGRIAARHTFLSVPRGKERKNRLTVAGQWAAHSQQSNARSQRDKPTSIEDLLASSSDESDSDRSPAASRKVSAKTDATDSDNDVESDLLDDPFASDISDSDASNKGPPFTRRTSVSEDSVCGRDSMPISMTTSVDGLAIDGQRQANPIQAEEQDGTDLNSETPRVGAPIHAWSSVSAASVPTTPLAEMGHGGAKESHRAYIGATNDVPSSKQEAQIDEANDADSDGSDADSDGSDDSDYDFLQDD